MYKEQLDKIIGYLEVLIDEKRQTPAKCFTITEVAALLKVNRATIDRAIKRNELRPSKIGDWRITQQQLDEWLESRRPIKKRKT